LLEKLAQIAPDFDAVVVAGSLPRGVSPQWFQALFEQLKRCGLKVALDTSGEALRAGLKAGPWLVKPNTEELADALGNAPDAISQLHQQGVEHVVVSDGAAGVSWYSPGASLHATPPKVVVASTVGAGDSLLAGMLHGLLTGDTPEQTLRRATAIAAMAVTQIGFGISDHAQLARLESGVHVRALTEQ
jgi:1-phosphofructokinase